MEVDEVVSQLGCLQTNDQDELVSQLMRLAPTLSFNTAKFYLEMNQWNVQAAVCSYFDLETANTLPGMVFLQDVTIGEGESIPPSTHFVKTWRVQNPGPERWPPGCLLRFTAGENLARQERVVVDSLEPYTATDISVEMLSPALPGMYESKWRMATATGSFFGETIWVIISVEATGTLAITQQFSKLDQLGSRTDNSQLNSEYNPFRGRGADSME